MESINLNLIPQGANPVVHAKQFDEGRGFRFNLFNGTAPIVLTGAETITCNVKKPDGNLVTVAVTNTSSNYVEVYTTLQMCACYGANLGEIRLEEDGNDIGTLNFTLSVEESPLNNGIESESSIHNLNTMVDEMVAEEVATQYDSSNVIFDEEPTDNHGIGYTVTSEGIKTAIDNAFDYDNTASGSLVHIEDGADNIPVKSLVSEIVAVESGSGEKSPDNPYTISGFDSGIITDTDNDQITNTYTFAFGQTVYGGHFDNKGNLVVTHKFLEFDYQSNWRFENLLGGNFYVACGNDVKASQFGDDLSCNCSPSSSVLAVTQNSCLISVAKNFNFTWGGTLGITSVDDFKSYLQTNNLVIKVKCLLANPITLAITSQDIPTLLGENNIYSNCGDVEVNYYTSKSNDILEFIDSEIGKKNGTNIPIEEDSQDSIKDYIDNEVSTINTSLSNKANKTEDTTITVASGYTLISSSCGKTDRLVHLNFNVEKSGGFATGWQVIGTTEFKPNTLVYCPLWNVTNGLANGEVRIDTDGTINFYIVTDGELRLNANIGYITD